MLYEVITSVISLALFGFPKVAIELTWHNFFMLLERQRFTTFAVPSILVFLNKWYLLGSKDTNAAQ